MVKPGERYITEWFISFMSVSQPWSALKKKENTRRAVAERRDKVLIGGKFFSNNKTKHVQNIHIGLEQPIRFPQLFL